jgi:hypothetical protein
VAHVTDARAPLIPCVYHDRYGYPYRWAIPAEVAWRLEGRFPRVSAFYRWRKAAERRGFAAAARF